MENITYSTNKKGVAQLDVSGFFEGWPQKPNDATLRASIENATNIVLAIDNEEKRLIGYITASRHISRFLRSWNPIDIMASDMPSLKKWLHNLIIYT